MLLLAILYELYINAFHLVSVVLFWIIFSTIDLHFACKLKFFF